MIETMAELRMTDFSVCGISARQEHWTSPSVYDNLASGRQLNLLHIITEGKRKYLFDGEMTELSAGTVLLIPDGTQYRTWNESVCSGIGICFSFGEPSPPLKKIIYHTTDGKGEYLRLFERLNESYIQETCAVLHHKSLLLRILDHMGDCQENLRYRDILSPAFRYMTEHFRENLPVSDYSSMCNLSESYFRRIFTAYTGMSPIAYRDSLRFEEALRLRASGAMMTEIAEQVGFCDASYLRRLFKKRTGHTMSRYVDTDMV